MLQSAEGLTKLGDLFLCCLMVRLGFLFSEDGILKIRIFELRRSILNMHCYLLVATQTKGSWEKETLLFACLPSLLLAISHIACCQSFSIRLKWLNHPVSQTEQLLDSWPLQCETAIATLPRCIMYINLISPPFTVNQFYQSQSFRDANTEIGTREMGMLI